MHCHRILGSFQDAEDVLQETLLSAWQALDRFDRRSLRAWLYRIATNRCFNYLRDASRRPQVANLPESGWSFPDAARSDDPWWLEPYPDALMDDVARGPEARYRARESIGLYRDAANAFIEQATADDKLRPSRRRGARRTRRVPRSSYDPLQRFDKRDLVRRIRALEQELEAEQQRRGSLAYDQQALRAKILRLETEIILLHAEHNLP